MGLCSGCYGVKKFVKTTFPDALREFPTIESAVKSTGHTQSQTAVLLDGNVLVMQIPVAVFDFDGYVKIFGGFIKAALDAADTVFVVFDEPSIVSRAKLDEQRRRDLSRAKTKIVMSDDLEKQFAPTDDNYTLEVIKQCNPHDLMSNRKARSRFYDALCKRTMTELMNRNEYENKTLTFDGIDARGASRGFDEEREAGMFSNCDKIETLMARGDGDARIGEGDLKLTDIESEIQFLRNEGKLFHYVEIIFVCTIDTDSIAIELMHQSAKNEALRASKDEGCETGRQIKSVLCFREITGKRNDPENPQIKMFSCLDMEILHKHIMERLFGKLRTDLQSHLHRAAMALLSAGWCLCGCDFCELKGMRSDIIWQSVVQIARNEPSLLKKMSAVWELTRTSTAAEIAEGRDEMAEAIERMVNLSTSKLEELPRMSRALASAKLANKSDFLKPAWVVLYWAGLEFKSLNEWGFSVSSTT